MEPKKDFPQCQCGGISIRWYHPCGCAFCQECIDNFENHNFVCLVCQIPLKSITFRSKIPFE